eukprot:scaffold17461_cov53-Attheya_sp.AAC.10
MGLFRIRSKKGRALLDDDDELPESAPTPTGSSRTFPKSRSAPRKSVRESKNGATSSMTLSSSTVSRKSHGNGNAANSNANANANSNNGSSSHHTASLEPPSLEMLPQLVDDLKEVDHNDTSGDVAARTLRMLFSLSEHAHSDHRTALVRDADGQLVPVLLDFLGRCERSSSEQYLVLLVLNNISIPSENKRIIAMDCGGAPILSRLLCDDPSCHLMAIILVNLTFADADLRNELVSPRSSIELVEALSYALRVASLSPAEHNNREPLSVADENGPFPPRKLLADVMAEDHRQRRNWNETSQPTNTRQSQSKQSRQPRHDWDILQKSGLVFDASKQLYPETARWCLCALKNLTRPSRDALSAHALMDTGIVPLLLRIITVGGYIPGTQQHHQQHSSSPTTRHYSTGSNSNPSDPPSSTHAKPTALVTTGLLDDEIPSAMNSPASWDSNSMHDAALFTILNMSVIPAARQYLRDEDAVHILSLIADYRKPIRRRSSGGSIIAGVPSTPLHHDNDTTTHSELKQQQLQSLKARMALAYLVGSEGHYGQPRSRSSSTSIYAHPDNSVLHVSALEAELLVELLANTLHHRAKDGPGGYSAATFTVKGTLYAIRCLLTNHTNQVTFFATAGVKLNALLLKAVALHSIQQVLTIDAEAAEHAYSITPPGRHATEQLLLRKGHLTFGGSVSELGSVDEAGPSKSDFSFSGDLLRGVSHVVMEQRQSGVRPLDEIFDRPIVRSRPPKRGSLQHETTVRSFPSALHAVQELSFGSSKVRHMNAIDDIVIANNIASSAKGLKTESYNYYWSWKDASRGKDFERPSSSQVKVSQQMRACVRPSFCVPVQCDSVLFPLASCHSNLLERVKSSTMKEDEPFSIFGLKCGPTFCAADTST